MDLSQPAADLLDLIALLIRSLADDRELSLTAFAVLGTLQRGGSQRITMLAAAESVSQPSMTQLIQRLESRGLVERSSDPADGRVALVSLTGQGAAVLAARRQRNAEQVAGILADLPADDVRALAGALAAVLPAIRQRVGSVLAVSGTGRAS